MMGTSLRTSVPPQRLRLSQWIEKTIRLPEVVSALPGKIQLWPYQYEIADAISDPLIERVTLVKPVRVGFTTLLTGAIGSYAANDPAPTLVLVPTQADCRDYMVSDIEPIFDDSPDLRGLLSDDNSAGGEAGERNTLLARRFPGGTLKIVPGHSPRNLRRHTAKNLLVDEADAIEAGAEGNPIKLAERRTFTFADRKIIIGSTPIHTDTSAVLREHGRSDQRVFECPCPHCGVFFEIMWQNIVWPEGDPDNARCKCPECEEFIENRDKARL